MCVDDPMVCPCSGKLADYGSGSGPDARTERVTTVRGVVVSENQFHGYNPPIYECEPGERVLSAELRRESGNQLTLYLAVISEADRVDS